MGKRRRWTTVWTTVWTDGQDQESWTSFVKVAALSAVSPFPAGSIDCSDDKHFWFMLRSVLSVQGGIMSASIVEKISNLRGRCGFTAWCTWTKLKKNRNLNLNLNKPTTFSYRNTNGFKDDSENDENNSTTLSDS